MEIKRVLIFLVVIIALVDLAYFYPKLTGKGVYETELAIVKRVIDGDTIVVDNETKVRLLCINSPERGKQYYEEAKENLMFFENKTIGMLRDDENVDKYERKLRYIFYKNRFINKEILEKGLASLYMCGGKYAGGLEKAEQKAREQERGIWKKSNGKCKDCIELLALNPEEEFFILKNNCDFSCELEGKDEANHFVYIDLLGNEEKKIQSKGNIWNNAGDSLFLRDGKGLVLYYNY